MTNMGKLLQMISYVRFRKSPTLNNVDYSQVMIYLDRYQSQPAYTILEKSKASQMCLTISHSYYLIYEHITFVLTSANH